MSAQVYIGIGFAVFIVTVAIQYLGWTAIAGRRLRDPDLAVRQAALKRWAVFGVAYQVLLLAAIGVYILFGVAHLRAQPAWPAPAVGAVIGTALALQVVVVGITRAARPSR